MLGQLFVRAASSVSNPGASDVAGTSRHFSRRLGFAYLAGALGRTGIYGKELVIIVVAPILTLTTPTGQVSPEDCLISLCAMRIFRGIGFGVEYPMASTIMTDHAVIEKRGVRSYIFHDRPARLPYGKVTKVDGVWHIVVSVSPGLRHALPEPYRPRVAALQAGGGESRARPHDRVEAAPAQGGRRVAFGSGNCLVRIWDALTGRILSSQTGHKAYICCVAISPDDRQICSGDVAGDIRLWDAESGAPIGSPMTGHSGCVNSVAYSPEGAWIVSGSDDHTVRTWGADTGLQLGDPLEGNRDGVSSIAWCPDRGMCIASGSLDRTVRLWSSAAGTILWILEHSDAVLSVCFSPNRVHVVSGTLHGNIDLWNRATGQLERTIQGHSTFGPGSLSLSDGVESVSVSPSGRHIASGSRDSTVRIWDAATGDAVGEPLVGSRDWVHAVAFSPDGRSILSASGNGELCI